MQCTSGQLHDLNLAAIMDRWPHTLPVFFKHRMLCVGCSIAPFHTVADACREHDLDEDMILGELVAAINSHQ